MLKRSADYKKLIQSRRWILLRNEKLSKNAICENCLTNGVIAPATEVHHIIPIDSGINKEHKKQLAYNYSNLQALCHKCHVQAHIKLNSKAKKTIQERNKNITNNFINSYLK